MKKISFLIAAHNEEGIIAKPLENLSKLPYDNYEVIIGLDGCTDRTEQIVKNYCKKLKNFRYFNLNIRKGKTFVINEIIKKARGDIIIIHDADWIFNVVDKKHLMDFISVFNDKKIGGIAESFPVEWDFNKLKRANLGYKMIAYSSYYWLNYQKERMTEKKGKIHYVKSPKMFMTNIFRRELYKENLSLADDFERTYDVMNSGFNVVLFDDPNMPRMIAVYDYISVRQLFNQKVRNALAREQVNSKKKANIGISSYYIPSILYMFKNSWKKGFSIGMITSFWILLATLASIYSKFNKLGTSEGWMLRARK